MWIINCSMHSVMHNYHLNPGENSMLIQIVDPDMEFVSPGYKQFKEVHQFKFLDIETPIEDDRLQRYGCRPEQAEMIVTLLKTALDQQMNVVVHCVAGICRSGAVTEVGLVMGFDELPLMPYRQPNIRAKRMLLDAALDRDYI